MKQFLSFLIRGPGLAIFAVLVFAVASFLFFTGVRQPAPSPAAAPTATRTPEPTAIFGPLPTKPPFPTAVPRFTMPPTPFPSPSLVLTPIKPTVTSWSSFQGKSGFSFSYPSGWNVSEDYITDSPMKPVIIHLSNVRGSFPRNTTIIPGAMMIELVNYPGAVPAGGTPFVVGSQKFPGFQFVNGRDNPTVEPQFRVLDQSITIHFSAGNRQWAISGSFYPPAEGVAEYGKIFYQIVGSLRYETKQ